MKFLKSTQRGFTLIELLVVIAIISLLSSVILAAVGEARNKAKLASIKEMTTQLKIEAELYYGTHGSYYEDPDSELGFYAYGSGETGFIDSENTRKIISQIQQQSGSSAVGYTVGETSWALIFDVSNIVFKPINTTYAAPVLPEGYIGTNIDYICIDSSGNFVQNYAPGEISGADYFEPIIDYDNSNAWCAV